MQFTFAIVFFVIVGLHETLRHGVLGLDPFETNGLTHGALTLAALFLLRGDISYVVRRPGRRLYGDARLGWSWSRTVLGVFLGPVLLAIPFGFGFVQLHGDLGLILDDVLIKAVLIQVLLIGVAEGLFFREAAVKAFGSNMAGLYFISVLALFIFYIPSGLPQALIAAAAGAYFLTLRLIGTNILVLALIGGASKVFFDQTVPLGLTENEMWSYAGYFTAAALLLSLFVFSIFTVSRRGPAYA